MTIEELQKQTNINVQEKANLIWDIATALYGEYKHMNTDVSFCQ